MSTIVRSSSDSRAWREGRGGRADGNDHARRGERDSQRPLSARALRVRNACVCHSAARLGLAMPTDAELAELPADATLGEAVDWWRARAPGAEAVAFAGRGSGVGLVLRTVVIMGVTLIGLAFSYGQAQ